jgi:hypothetical protein
VATLAYQSVGYAGAAVTSQTPNAIVDIVDMNPRGFVWVKNGGGVSTTVTIPVPGTTQGQANPDISVSVSAGQERLFGPLVEGLYDPTFGGVLVGVTPTASVSIAAVTVG